MSADILICGKDSQGNCVFAPILSSKKYSVSIAAAGNATITVPSFNGLKVIAAMCYPNGGEIWVAQNNLAAPPNSSAFTLTNSVVNPAQITVTSGNTLNFYNNSSSSQNIGIVFWLGE